MVISEEDDDIDVDEMEELDSAVKLCSPIESRQRSTLMSFNSLSAETASKIHMETSDKPQGVCFINWLDKDMKD